MIQRDDAWCAENHRRLSAELGLLRHYLERRISGQRAPSAILERLPPDPAFVSALDHVERGCGLTSFERWLLLLCAGIELDPELPGLLGRTQQDPARNRPSFGLALALLPDAHFSALAYDRPLRRWRLITACGSDGFIQRAIQIDERILHYLLGLDDADPALDGVVERVEPGVELVPTQRAVADKLAALWQSGAEARPPVPLLCGADPSQRESIAVEAARQSGKRLCRLQAGAHPASRDAAALQRSWEREALLLDSALLIEWSELEAESARHAALHLMRTLRCPVVVGAVTAPNIPGRGVVGLDVEPPRPLEGRQIWRERLGGLAPSTDYIESLCAQFHLGPSAIQVAAAEAVAAGPALPLERALWSACRAQSRPRLDDLATRIEAVASWRDLVLPAPQLALLRGVAAQVRHRHLVYDTWGFAAGTRRGLGISALFAGPSGTGKTMAAEVLAGELELDLYRIDLSQVVSKYIGETEKNLRRVFDAADEGGAILLFDEADALFGKRSEVRDSHDRYANLEVSYLLQRMEAYRGLAILTTNLKNALDVAFMRRLRFVVQFPFPDTEQRQEIWRRAFPPQAQLRSVDFTRLARVNVAGGHIRNIALNAAFMAASEGGPLDMAHLLRATRMECAKLDKTLTEAEVVGWQ